MPKMPSAVRLGGVTWQIVSDSDGLATEEAYGMTDHANLCIRIDLAKPAEKPREALARHLYGNLVVEE